MDSLNSPLLATEEENQRRGTVRARDLPPISTFSQFAKESWVESKKLWTLAGPAILTILCQYAIGSVTQIFAGHLGSLQLAAVSIGITVIGGFTFGFMLGMGSALETLCGQAVGAGQIHMLGVFMQRSWIILTVTAVLLTPIYIFSTPILKLLGQADDISDLAGVFAIWTLPQLFAFAINFPIQKFLQSQSKVMVMTWISAIGLIVHVFLSWLCISKLGWGLVGAALTLNITWWTIVICQLVYAVRWSPGAWTGLSLLAFYELWAFVRLSLASAVMLCLEMWYFMTLILLTGHLKNAEIAVDSISICMNLNGWEAMLFIGMNAAISVRVSNELGAGHPRATKFSIKIVVATSVLIGIICMVIVLIMKDKFAILFTDSEVVIAAVAKLANFLAVTMLLNSVQPVLSGVAIGGGWQALIAYINLGCYYVIGVPLGLLLGYKFDFGAKGIWSGMIGGTALQTFILLLIVYFTNWEREATVAEDRIKIWGGSVEALKHSSVDATNSTERNNQSSHV